MVLILLGIFYELPIRFYRRVTLKDPEPGIENGRDMEADSKETVSTFRFHSISCNEALSTYHIHPEICNIPIRSAVQGAKFY